MLFFLNFELTSKMHEMMYKLILGHFHVHRKSNMAAMAAILKCCWNFIRTTPPEPKVIETWCFHHFLEYGPVLKSKVYVFQMAAIKSNVKRELRQISDFLKNSLIWMTLDMLVHIGAMTS